MAAREPNCQVVVDLETDPYDVRPVLGVFDRYEEDVVLYTDPSGEQRQAPQDCVAVVPGYHAPAVTAEVTRDELEELARRDSHRRIAQEALANGMAKDVTCTITMGELVLFHVLLQDYGLAVVGGNQFIPLMERHVRRMDDAKPA